MITLLHMATESHNPWASGPGEILRHGLDLLRRDNDTNRRLAMISIDNAVELMIKTYLGLPKRVTGLSITRKEYQEISESFPALLDALEKYVMDKLDGIDLGVIEWYHRLRNELYHQGNGLTVEIDKVQIYAQLANQLFKNLFGFELVARGTIGVELLGEFMTAWGEVEHFLRILMETATQETVQSSPFTTLRDLRTATLIDRLSPSNRKELDELRLIRNAVVHAVPGSDELLTRKTVDRILRLAHRLRMLASSIPKGSRRDTEETEG
jgi:hypothetical protein